MRKQSPDTEGRKRNVLLAIWNLKREGKPQSYPRIAALAGLPEGRSDYYVALLAQDGLVVKGVREVGAVEITSEGEKLVMRLLAGMVAQ